MKIAIIAFIIFSLKSHAVDTCKSINEYQLRLGVHTSNYKNADTTRTPEGGPYKYKSVSCQLTCKINESNTFKKHYLPHHPDADGAGYVAFPAINKEEEKALITLHAKALVMVAKGCPAVVKTLEIENGPAVLMQYNSGSIISDIINFEQSGDVTSFVRQSKDGRSDIINL